MKLLFKQRLFSWLDSYDVFDESGNPVYEVKGQLAWGHCLKIFDHAGQELGMIRERLLSWMPKFEIYRGEQYIGCISREFTFFRPKYHIDCNGWQIEGDWLEWDYDIRSSTGELIASVSKEIWNWTDTYVIDVIAPGDALYVLMLVLAIDAEKCSRPKS